MYPVSNAPRAHAVQSACPLPTREQIQDFQARLASVSVPLPEPEHIWHDGWYERRLLLPAGMVLVGKIHKAPHYVGVIRGRAFLVSEHGRAEVRGGYLDYVQGGIKRVGYAIEDTLFFNLHPNPTNTRDLDELEARLIEPESLVLAPRAAFEVLQ